MLKGKTLLDYTNLFSPNDFKRTIKSLKENLTMNNIIELTDRLDEINKIRDYFHNEIKEISIIWYVKYSFIRFISRYTSRY